MKHGIIASSFAFGLVCVSVVSVAQDQSQTANLQHVTVTAAPAQYETYTVDLSAGFGLMVRVGSRHGQYMQAWHATERLEAMRKQGMAQSPYVNVAIDNSSGEGHTWQILLSDRTRKTLAIVNVYCRHFVVRDGGDRCRLVPMPVSGSADDRGLAARQAGSVSLAQVQVGESP